MAGNGGRSAHCRRAVELLAQYPITHKLIASLAEFSPFLWRLVREQPKRLLRLLNADPETFLAAQLHAAARAIAVATAEPEAMRVLRRLKAEATLWIAVLDIGEVLDITQLTRALTDVAEHAVRAAVRFVLASAVAEGKLRARVHHQPDQDSGYFVLAMGKMGAGELNFSSDIDLMVFFNPAAEAVAPELEPAPLFVRLTRRVVKLLQERTPDGYVFRVDLRLRPDPASTRSRSRPSRA